MDYSCVAKEYQMLIKLKLNSKNLQLAYKSFYIFFNSFVTRRFILLTGLDVYSQVFLKNINLISLVIEFKNFLKNINCLLL